MGSKKGRQIFGTVLSVAAIVASGGAAAGLIASSTAAWMQGAALVYGAWAARRERKLSEQGRRASFEDRKIMVRGGTVAKHVVYGYSWMSGVMVYTREPLSVDDPWFWLVFALPVAHEVDAFEAIYFGNTPVTPLDAFGWVGPGPFRRTFSNTNIMQGTFGTVFDVNLLARPEDMDEPYTIRPETITIHVRGLKPGANPVPSGDTPEDAYMDRLAVATLLPGTTIVQVTGAQPGDTYVLTYTYEFVRRYMRVFRGYGQPDQGANWELQVATQTLPENRRWTAAHQLRGIPYLVFQIRADQDVFPQELENITVLIRGKKDILDVRNSSVNFTNGQNPMLAARDYCVKYMQLLAGEIHTNLLITGANYCQAGVSEPSGPNGATRVMPRFALNVMLSTEVPPMENLGIILSSCDGSAVWCGDNLDLRPGMYEHPVVEIEDSDWVGVPTISKRPARMDRFNAIRARITNGEKLFWPMEDVPPVYSDFWKAEDGGIELLREVDLPGTVHPYMGHRILKQMLNRSRGGFRMRGVVTIKGIQLNPEEMMRVTCSAAGVVDKIMRVKKFQVQGYDRVMLELQEDAALFYDWTWNEAGGYDPAPDTIIPSIRNVPPLLGLSADTSQAAAVFGPNGDVEAMCRAYWIGTNDILVRSGGAVEVRWKRYFDAEWRETVRLKPTTTEYRFPIQRGDLLNIQARWVNSIVGGEWSSIKKEANDSPTKFLTGNLLVNPSFGFRTQWQGTTHIDYQYDGWFGPFGAGNVELQPYYELAGYPGIGGTLDPANPGYVYWFENDPAAGVPTTVYIQSAKVAVRPGDRMVAFCMGHSNFTDQNIHINFYTNTDGPAGSWASPATKSYQTLGIPFNPTSMSHLVTMSGFMTVPDTAATATFALVSRRRFDVPVDRQAAPIWFRPYFGRASVGQITLPPWSK